MSILVPFNSWILSNRRFRRLGLCVIIPMGICSVGIGVGIGIGVGVGIGIGIGVGGI